MMFKRWMPWCAVACGAAVLVLIATTMSADPPRAVSAQDGKDGKDAKKAKEAPPQPAAAPDVKIAPSRVAAVTVYPNSALVTREVDVPAGQGMVELIISPLPPTTVSSSLYSEGLEGVRVLTTRYRTRPILQDTREDVRKLLDEIGTLATTRDKVESDIKAIQENLKMLSKMEGFMSVTTIQGAEKGVLNAEAAIKLANHIKESRVETSRELVGLQQQMKANQEKADFASRRLAEVNTGKPRTERDAVVVVERANGAAGKVRLNYLVDSASWRPQYKLRAGKAAKDPVQVEYLASLVQYSGEDWGNVKLVLSTAAPMLNAAPPDLQGLKVAAVHKGSVPAGPPLNIADLEAQIRSLREKAQKDFNERKPATGIGLFNTASALDQSFELMHPDVAIQRGCALAMSEGPTVVYHIATPLAVPSRNEEQVLEIAKFDLVGDMYYKAVPLLTTHVYRQADLVNKSAYVLLPGDATMYLGTDFVGQMNLPLIAVGEQFTAGFGIDPQLQVKRQMVDRAHTTQGGNQMLRFEFRTTVSNFKNEKVKLQVWDRVPQAESDAVNIALSKVVPELSKDPAYLKGQRPKNVLRWDLMLEPNTINEKATQIQYEFKMELDRQLTITNFQSAGVFGQPGQVTPIAAIPPASPAEQARIEANMGKLSPQDQALARSQVFCAIDQDARLGSMGPIHKLMLKNQPVFVCCRGCAAEATAHPDETLQKVANLMTRVKGQK
ncbi:MAG: mucoidy inhibitor MuiA family protein [Planctomycetes bacterium]|nr:mucoidy inhibitor MuiA family protein [Planctomycetota bacterium]